MKLRRAHPRRKTPQVSDRTRLGARTKNPAVGCVDHPQPVSPKRPPAKWRAGVPIESVTMAKVLDWPELEEMSQEELLKLVQEIRQNLCRTEDASDFCLVLAEHLKVDCST